MTTFDDTFRTHAAPSLLTTFGETITYKPKNGTPREITAIVDRGPPEALGFEGGRAALLTVTVLDDGTSGISTDELQTGGDRVELSVKKDGPLKSLPIHKIADDSGGMLRLEVLGA